MSEWINKVVGPVIPLPTPFNEKQEILPEVMESYTSYLVDNGIRNVMTTVGTSRYNLLTFEEIQAINDAMIKGAKGKANTIVANPTVGGTKHAIEFAKHSEDIGADLFLLYFPERHYGEANTLKFFETVAKNTNMNILIHEMPMRNGFGGPSEQYSLDLIDRLLDIDNIVGLKEEALDADYSNKIVDAVKHKSVIIGAGGGMSPLP
jgi:dihydrodipicolinate synthase/N-acetylneuraminate lyase